MPRPGGSLRSSRQQPVHRGPCDLSPRRDRPAEPQAGGPARESLREGRPRRGGVAAGAEPLLVRSPGDRGPATIRPDHRPSRGEHAGPAACGLRLDGVDHVRAWRGSGRIRVCGSRSRGDRRMDDDRDGRVSCAETRAHGIAPDGWKKRRCDKMLDATADRSSTATGWTREAPRNREGEPDG